LKKAEALFKLKFIKPSAFVWQDFNLFKIYLNYQQNSLQTPNYD